MEPIEREQSILMAAKRVFAQRGYHASGVADIIEEAKIARGTFYLYFKSKRDVFSALMEHIIQSISSRLVAIPLDQPEQILHGLLENTERIKTFFFDDPDLAKIIIKEATSLDADSSERFQEIRRQLAEWLSRLIQQWQKAGVLRPMDPNIIAFTFLGSVKELFEQYLISGHLASESEKITETVMNIYLFGIISPEFNKLALDHYASIQTPAAPKIPEPEKKVRGRKRPV